MGTVTRRQWLSRGVKLAGGLALASSLSWPTRAGATVLDKLFRGSAQATPAITPNDDFYVTSYRSPPTIRINEWELAIKGLVESPVTLRYPELLARPLRSEIVTLECVGNSVAGDAVGTAFWEGVPLKSLLEEAGVSAQARRVVFRAADGYSDSLPTERVMAGDVLVAVTMNRVPLPQAHGFPARIIVPGVYGMKQVQWLTEIEAVDQDYKGYYQHKGWSEAALVKTMSRIDVPGHGETLRSGEHVVKGLAFAGSRGILSVELSADGGDRWMPAQLEPELSPYAWRFWTCRWQPQKPGQYALKVRAKDGTGNPQASTEQDPFPDGAAGLHEITVTVSDVA
nr:molybdopterin-dependent oxidoreductase [Nitrospirota bacterium]